MDTVTTPSKLLFHAYSTNGHRITGYLNMSCCGIVNPDSFNVADVLIFGGALALALGHEGQAQRARPAP